MRHVAAYLLLRLGGNDAPSKSEIEAVIKAGGAEADGESIDLLLKQVEGKDLAELIKEGTGKLCFSAGGGGGGGGGGAAAGGADGGAAAEAEKEESEKEESVGGAGGMFEDDEDDW